MQQLPALAAAFDAEQTFVSAASAAASWPVAAAADKAEAELTILVVESFDFAGPLKDGCREEPQGVALQNSKTNSLSEDYRESDTMIVDIVAAAAAAAANEKKRRRLAVEICQGYSGIHKKNQN